MSTESFLRNILKAQVHGVNLFVFGQSPGGHVRARRGRQFRNSVPLSILAGEIRRMVLEPAVPERSRRVETTSLAATLPTAME